MKALDDLKDFAKTCDKVRFYLSVASEVYRLDTGAIFLKVYGKYYTAVDFEVKEVKEDDFYDLIIDAGLNKMVEVI